MNAAADTAAATGAEEAVNLDDALANALDALDKPGEAGGERAADAGEIDAGKSAGDDSAPKGKSVTGEAPRDKHGRFVPRDKVVADASDAGGQADGTDQPDGDADDQPLGAEQATPGGDQASGDTKAEIVEGKDISRAPTTWKPEAAAEFSKLPATVRREIYRREEDFHRGIEQYRNAAAVGQDFARRAQPYAQMFQQAQLVPSELWDAALKVEYSLRTGKPEERVNLMANLTDSYGFRPEEKAALIKALADSAGIKVGEGGQVELPPNDPKYEALQRKIADLESKLSERERREAEARKHEEERARTEVQKEIESFANDPKNEFYGLVREDMLQLIKSGQANGLREAYDKAIWINPVTRERLLARQREADRKSAAEKAAAAQKANQLNVTPRATPPGKAAGKGTIDEALGSALDEVLSRSA